MKKISLLCLIIMVTLLSSCIGRSGSYGKSVAEMTEQEIVSGNVYSKGSSITKSANNHTTLKVGRFSGIERLATFTPRGSKITVTLSCTVESGELRLVLCDSKSIVLELDLNEETSFTIPADDGKYFLKAAGKDAKYNLEFSYDKREIPIPETGGEGKFL